MPFELLIEVVPDPYRGAIVVRCTKGVLRIGDVITQAHSTAGETEDALLTVDSIERWEGFFVDELDPPYVGRIRLLGELRPAVAPLWKLSG